MDIITLAICGVICNADSFEHIAEFGRAKHQWFIRFLELTHGIPSPDTFERVFDCFTKLKWDNDDLLKVLTG